MLDLPSSAILLLDIRSIAIIIAGHTKCCNIIAGHTEYCNNYCWTYQVLQYRTIILWVLQYYCNTIIVSIAIGLARTSGEIYSVLVHILYSNNRNNIAIIAIIEYCNSIAIIAILLLDLPSIAIIIATNRSIAIIIARPTKYCNNYCWTYLVVQ